MKAPRSALWIIAVGILILLAIVAWLIHILADSSHWCGVIIGAATTSGQKPLIQDCTPILMELIKYLGWVALSTLATAALAFIVITITDRKASIDVHGPGGIGLKAGGDDVVHDGDPVTLRKEGEA